MHNFENRFPSNHYLCSIFTSKTNRFTCASLVLAIRKSHTLIVSFSYQDIKPGHYYFYNHLMIYKPIYLTCSPLILDAAWCNFVNAPMRCLLKRLTCGIPKVCLNFCYWHYSVVCILVLYKHYRQNIAEITVIILTSVVKHVFQVSCLHLELHHLHLYH